MDGVADRAGRADSSVAIDGLFLPITSCSERQGLVAPLLFDVAAVHGLPEERAGRVELKAVRVRDDARGHRLGAAARAPVEQVLFV